MKEKCDTLYVGVGHHHKAMAFFVTRRKVCVLWKLEGDISVSEGEMPCEFQWDTSSGGIQGARARARRPPP